MEKIICEYLKEFPNASFEEFLKYYEGLVNEKFEEYRNKNLKKINQNYEFNK